METSGIYKIENPKGKIYIGQSVNIEQRFSNYKRLKNCIEQYLLFNSFLKYGVLNHKFEIIEECGLDKLNLNEEKWMEIFKATDRKYGLNIRGAGSHGQHSADTRIKMSKAHKGKIISEETREKHRIRMLKTPINYWLGKKRSKKDREKFSKSHIGLINANKPIVQFDLNGKEIGRYESATDAGRKLGIGRTSIKNNLRGLSKSCNKSIFKYASM